mgnify:CR=1 FL=1
MRCFIALDISNEMRKVIWEKLEILRKRLSSVRWVAPTNYHVSLAFLGEINDEEIQIVSDILENAAKNVPPFILQISGAGIFGKIESPRVLWAGIAHSEELTTLQKIIVENLKSKGFKTDERPYSPHLTLARFSRPERSKALGEWLKEFSDFNFGQIEEKEILLMQSTLMPDGAVYKPAAIFKLSS